MNTASPTSREAGGRPSRRPTLPCPHYPACVGCPLIGTTYGEQLRRKHDIVVAAFAAYPELAGVDVAPVVGAPRAFGYRNQVKLVARRTRNDLLLGIYRPGTHQVIDISECPAHQPLIAATLAGCRRVFERLGVPVYDERSAQGWLRYLVLRATVWQKSVQIVLVVHDRSFGAERELVRALRRLPHVRSVLLNLNANRGNVILTPAFVTLAGTRTMVERVAGLTLQIDAGAFVQANLTAARRVYDRVLACVGHQPDGTAVDLYAGVGAISLRLAHQVGRVFGIEESVVAVRDAQANIRRNGRHNVRFLAGAVEEVVPELITRLGRVDVVTLNPPRQGVGERARAAIVAASPARLVYASCNPTTLARDANWLAQRGYVLRSVQPFDLLPQTEHVECVAAFERQTVA